MTADIINFNKARKAKARSERTLRAQENRAKFGTSKVERTRIEVERSKRDRLIDGAERLPTVAPTGRLDVTAAANGDDAGDIDPGSVS
jgi:hypothetical protein